VSFSLKCEATRPGDSLVLVGGPEEMGGWDAHRALVLTTDAASFPSWSTEVSLPSQKVGMQVEYKYVIRRGGGLVQWESFVHNRYMIMPESGTRKVTVDDGWFDAWNEGQGKMEATKSIEDPQSSSSSSSSSSSASTAASSSSSSSSSRAAPPVLPRGAETDEQPQAEAEPEEMPESLERSPTAPSTASPLPPKPIAEKEKEKETAESDRGTTVLASPDVEASATRASTADYLDDNDHDGPAIPSPQTATGTSSSAAAARLRRSAAAAASGPSPCLFPMALVCPPVAKSDGSSEPEEGFFKGQKRGGSPTVSVKGWRRFFFSAVFSGVCAYGIHFWLTRPEDVKAFLGASQRAAEEALQKGTELASNFKVGELQQVLPDSLKASVSSFVGDARSLATSVSGRAYEFAIVGADTVLDWGRAVSAYARARVCGDIYTD